ncbi:type I phosphodiesterase/nucleotide pyrophosphatase/phosphate transferase [Hesseltinella vesiculosa]|uniref:Type I phosphodiesterase/nucleotide pyrophosphatase/phosphate transferase n=1 Tax=Hesseltinella vesiculosa TaxID=101127 RepID=A0A1X2GPV5_9FUNG|nr:type I phosphodiesterase/nucleotide pyrophosphatase/phosphate transferase [Hesseltinella vesiculosa]
MYNNGTHDYHPTVILISLDGVVSHDLVLHVTPHLSSLADKGGRAHWMTPSFPPITFPNHWSLVTGLYPEAHGIINNVFWDPVLNDTFNYKNPKQSWDVKWWGGEPIWSTVSRQGKKSGVIMWPGCSTSFPDGWQPSYVVPFQDGIPFDHKTDIALDWLDLPIQDRPQFIGLYVPEVDQAGHRYGPYANETLTQLNLADASIGRLVKQLEARNLTDIVQLMIVSDHGMSATDASRLIFYDDELTKDEMDLILVTEMAPNVAIWPQPNVDQEEAVGRLYDAFSRLRDVHGGDQAPFKVYKREDIPKRLHFRDNVRIPPLLVIPHPGWSIITHAEYDPAKDKVYHPRGAHGYDNLSPQSRAIFITHGPFWPAETIFYPFWNVELYHTIANILDVKPSANNGTTRGILPIES